MSDATLKTCPSRFSATDMGKVCDNMTTAWNAAALADGYAIKFRIASRSWIAAAGVAPAVENF